MDLFEALYTTRAMRRVSADPVPDEVLASMLDASIRAPSGSNAQNWRFVSVTDPGLREKLAPIYRRAWERLKTDVYGDRWEEAKTSGDAAIVQFRRSSEWLVENFARVPLWLFVFSRNDPSGASVYPAVWSAMLAARAHGVGTCLTTIMGMFEAQAVFDLLEVPSGKGWQLAAAVSCGYPLGRWGVAERTPVERVAFSDRWGEVLPFEVNGPLWSAGKGVKPHEGVDA